MIAVEGRRPQYELERNSTPLRLLPRYLTFQALLSGVDVRALSRKLTRLRVVLVSPETLQSAEGHQERCRYVPPIM